MNFDLFKLFPLPLPGLTLPKHSYEGKIDGIGRTVKSVSYVKDVALDNKATCTVVFDGGPTVVATHHILDNVHVPERILIDGADVTGDEVRTHYGVKIALPPKLWVAMSFRYDLPGETRKDTANPNHRIDVRAFVEI